MAIGQRVSPIFRHYYYATSNVAKKRRREIGNASSRIHSIVRSFSSTKEAVTTDAEQAAAKAMVAASENNGGESNSDDGYLGVLFRRLAMTLGIVYTFSEYGIEWTVCEGPSMMPTIQPKGEIVVIDRFTPKLWGLQGGDTMTKRLEVAQKLQDQHEQEELRTLAQSIANNNDNDQQRLWDEYERLLSSTATWHETNRIPINKLPPSQAWERFRKQITTGVSVGDVVVLQHPDRIGTVCKRVLGLPGDIVTKPTSRLGAERISALLYGEEPSTPLFLENDDDRFRKQQQRLQTKKRMLAEGLVIPDGHIWVEGDNPWNSSDSRNYGAIPASLIMGRVLLRLWPLRGHALMERGSRPEDEQRNNNSSLVASSLSGRIVVPVGWNDQRIVREYVPKNAGSAAKKALASSSEPLRGSGEEK